MKKALSTDSYKGVRDFYPEDMAVQTYIFDVWSQTAESFGFERYDASVLEPSDLYKAKGAENEEMVKEQTYTFTDRGGREVTLRPEMTPTVARMVAGRRRELSFPVRWYSIPNLFRYERTQRGRLREHWQLNCDIFGADDYTADVEIIALANQILRNFGADASMFEIRVNNRKTMAAAYSAFGIEDPATVTAITRLNDRKAKITAAEYAAALSGIVGDSSLAQEITAMIEQSDPGDNAVVAGLKELGIDNVVLDRSLARGFDYYTGTIFEIFDKHPDGTKRSMLGGGRYDNLTALFGGDAITGIGFGMGDVTMRDFLEIHGLLEGYADHFDLLIIPTDSSMNMLAQKLALDLRLLNKSLVAARTFRVSVDISDRKLEKKIESVKKKPFSNFIIFGQDESRTHRYRLRHNFEDLNDTECDSDQQLLESAINSTSFTWTTQSM